MTPVILLIKVVAVEIEENIFSIFISVSFVNFEHILHLFLVFKTTG